MPDCVTPSDTVASFTIAQAPSYHTQPLKRSTARLTRTHQTYQAHPTHPTHQTRLALKVHLHAELPLPRRADDGRDLAGVRHAARRVEYRRLRQPEVDAVGDVEAFRTELNPAAAADHDVLEHGEIKRSESWTH